MSAEEIAAQQAAISQQMAAGYMQAAGAPGQVAGVDVLVGVVMGQGSEAEQQALQAQQMQQYAVQMQQMQMQGVDPNMQGVPMIVQVPMQPGMDPAQAAAQGLILQQGPPGMTAADGVLVDPNAPGSVNRFKPTAKQREEMENCVRAGQYKRKCKELEDYARQEGLPYKAVLSWFDRNKSRLMLLDQQPSTTVIPCGQTGPDGNIVTEPTGMVVSVNNAAHRFKPTPEQILGA